MAACQRNYNLKAGQSVASYTIDRGPIRRCGFRANLARRTTHTGYAPERSVVRVLGRANCFYYYYYRRLKE